MVATEMDVCIKLFHFSLDSYPTAYIIFAGE